MKSSYSSALSEFFNLHTTAKDWTCQEINISVATSLDDDTPRDINLADTLGYRKMFHQVTKDQIEIVIGFSKYLTKTTQHLDKERSTLS